MSTPTHLAPETPLLIFGYGSLMWDPGFTHDAWMPARAEGWHRRFSLVSTISWGSATTPGVCAMLHPGGTAWGRAFVVAPPDRADALAYLDRREGAYRRRKVRVMLRRGGGLTWATAETYVAKPGHPRLRPDLGTDQRRRLLLQGIGAKGTSLEYLRRTAGALQGDGHKASDAQRILATVGL